MSGTGSSSQPEWDIEEDTILEPTDVNFHLSIGSAALAMSFGSLSQVNNEPIAAAKGNAESNDRPIKVPYCICIPNKAMHPITIMSLFIFSVSPSRSNSAN